MEKNISTYQLWDLGLLSYAEKSEKRVKKESIQLHTTQ